MRFSNTMIVLILMLTAAAVMAVPAAEPHASPHPRDHANHELSVATISLRPSRPSWAPLPVLRNNLASLPALKSMSKSPDSSTRARTAFLLGQIASPKCFGLLRALLRDRDPGVRMQSGIALACMGSSLGIRQCAAALSGTMPEWVKYYAIYGLWATHSRAGRRSLQKAKPGQSPLLKTALHGALTTRYVAPRKTPPMKIMGMVTSDPTFWIDAENVYEDEADWWFHHGDYDQLIRCESIKTFLCPQDIDNYDTIAYFQWSLGRDTQAVDTLKSGVTNFPDSSDAHYYLGAHYFLTKHYALAEKPLKQSVLLSSNELNLRTYAHCLEKLGKLDEALVQWNNLINKYPNDAPAVLNRDRVQKLLKF